MKNIIIVFLLCFSFLVRAYDWSVCGTDANCSCSSVSAGATAPSSNMIVKWSSTSKGISGSCVIGITGLIPNQFYDLVLEGYAYYGSGGCVFNGVSYSFTPTHYFSVSATGTASAAGALTLPVSFSNSEYDFALFRVNGTAASPPTGDPPVFDPNPVFASCVGGSSFSGTYSVVSGTAPITYSLSNLPSWLSGSGNSVSGTAPLEAGEYSFNVIATNDYGSDTLTVNITVSDNPAVGDPPVITSATTVNCVPLQAFSYTVTATGTAPLTLGVSGYPSFLTLSGDATLTGTLPLGQTNFSFTATADNAYGSDSKTVNVVIEGSGEPGDGAIHVIVDNFADLNNLAIFNEMTDMLAGLNDYALQANNKLDQVNVNLVQIKDSLSSNGIILEDIYAILEEIKTNFDGSFSNPETTLNEVTLPELPGQTDKYTDAEVQAKGANIPQILAVKERMNNLIGTPSGNWYFEFPLMWTGMVQENPKILLSESLATFIAWARKLFAIMVYAMGWLYWFDIIKGAFLV